MIYCSCCNNNLLNGLYAGEDWNSENYFIVNSFWSGEKDPICPSCAINRTKEMHETFINYTKLLKSIQNIYSGGDY